ncbi:acyltransferase [Mesorhizobium sp.]|uniref:acyltransferase family protein n=1 Tax=Mesorhizobium sp. TaxID=1871066 RepID=UPI001225BB15|nr:acyltransferase [Mesorhizobium sp.]TIN26412.1 MAG: acyltransferase [Mesorhizobium sp.]
MQNFVAIECLRAYLAWWVVIAHASQLSGWRSYLPSRIGMTIEAGAAAVNVFIIVSGFVITHLLIAKREAYPQYITRRAFRIWPVYLFCLAVAIAVAGLYERAYTLPWVSGTERRIDRFASEASYFAEHLVLHLTMLHGAIPDELLPDSSTAFLATAWSLSLEWQFYLVAPLLIALLLRSVVMAVFTVSICIVLFFVAKSGEIGDWQFNSFLPMSIQYFLIGIFTRIVIDKIRSGGLGVEYFGVLAMLIVSFAGSLEAVVWIVFSTCIMAEAGLLTFKPSFIKRIADFFVFNRRIAAVGSWSYSTYLIHVPIFSLVVGGYIQTVDEGMGQRAAIVLVVMCLPITFFVSWLMYSCIEKPFNLLGRTLVVGTRSDPAV